MSNYVQSVQSAVNTTNPKTASISGVSIGHLLFVVTHSAVATTPLSVTDGGVNPDWTLISSNTSLSSNCISLWYTIARSVSFTVTVDFGSAVTNGFFILEYKVVNTPDGNTKNTGSGTTWTTASITTLFAVETIIAIVFTTVGSPTFGIYTSRVSSSGLGVADHDVSSTSTYSESGTMSSGSDATILASFYTVPSVIVATDPPANSLALESQYPWRTPPGSASVNAVMDTATGLILGNVVGSRFRSIGQIFPRDDK